MTVSLCDVGCRRRRLSIIFRVFGVTDGYSLRGAPVAGSFVQCTPDLFSPPVTLGDPVGKTVLGIHLTGSLTFL